MKRGLGLLLAVGCCWVLLTGCSSYDEVNPGPKEAEPTDYVEWLCREYRRKAEEYGLNYNVEDGVYFEPGVGKKIFNLRTKDNMQIAATVYPNMDAKKEIYMEEYNLYFDPGKYAPELRDILTATFLIGDEALDEEGAREKTRQLVESYSEREFSEFVPFGDYVAVIYPHGITSRVWIYRPSQHQFAEVDPSEYQPITPELYEKELNRGTKVVAEGVVNWTQIPGPLSVASLATISLLDETGYDYRAEYAYDYYNFVEYEEGQRIRVYGKTDKTIFGLRIYVKRIEVIE